MGRTGRGVGDWAGRWGRCEREPVPQDRKELIRRFDGRVKLLDRSFAVGASIEVLGQVVEEVLRQTAPVEGKQVLFGWAGAIHVIVPMTGMPVADDSPGNSCVFRVERHTTG